MAAPELVPLGTLTATLGETHTIRKGPIGTRMVATVAAIELRGDRITADLCSPAAADWLTVSPDKSFGTLDVRATLKTDDGEIVHVEYSGRIDFATGKAVSAPLFEATGERYDWLNRLQAIGVGQNADGAITYELFEVRPA